MIAVLSFGANLGTPRRTISEAIDSLGDAVVARSRFYATSPVGGPDQPDFINACAIVTGSSPLTFLSFAQALEAQAHRIRRERWGPRTLDVDVIVERLDTGEVVTSDDPNLTLPHPRAHQRLFVLEPWAELEPDAYLPPHGPVDVLIHRLRFTDPSQRVRVLA